MSLTDIIPESRDSRRKRPQLENHPARIELANGTVLERDDSAQQKKGQSQRTAARSALEGFLRDEFARAPD